MVTYNDFKSKRPDGRFSSPWAAHMEKMRQTTPKLAYSPNMTQEEFLAWKAEVADKVRELLHMPESTPQPAPKKLGSVKRDTYTVEKWEYYPDEYMVIPFLILIPDTATAENPAPGVLCYPGSCNNKEALAGEPLLDRHMCNWNPKPELDKMAWYMVKNGMVAFAFDNPEIGETALDIVGPLGYTRTQMCFGYLQSGLNYVGMSVFYKLQLMDFIKSLPYVDANRLGISGHSLGTEAGLYMSVLCDDIKALVFNNALRDQRHNYMAITEYPDSSQMVNDIGNWHIIPDVISWFDFPDLCAALAPKYLAFTEGGADYWIGKVRSAFETMGVPERLMVSYYPMYADESTRTLHDKPADYGMSLKDFDAVHYIDVDEHAFRAETAVKLLKTCFGL